MIKYHNITHDDMLNGDGLRVVLWVSGCTHHCKECQNPVTWDPDMGADLDPWSEAEFWEWLKKPWTQGATFSGGDPLHPRNREYIGRMIARIKDKYPAKDIWVYTGYTLNDDMSLTDGVETFTLDFLNNIDILVDGKFECDTRSKDIEAKRKVLWRGSSNQRVIEVKKSIEAKKVIERGN